MIPGVYCRYDIRERWANDYNNIGPFHELDYACNAAVQRMRGYTYDGEPLCIEILRNGEVIGTVDREGHYNNLKY